MKPANTRLIAALVVGAAMLGACSSGSKETGAESTAQTTGQPATTATTAADAKTATTKAPGTTAASKSDIVATATAAGQFKTLAQALTAAGLVETLQGEGPFTVFAPTDDAFAKLPAGTLETLLKPENKGQLTTILTYHVVKGKVPASEVVKMDGKTVETVAGQSLTIEVDGDKVFLLDASGNKAAVVKTDVEASNGVIHVIDTVVLPKS